MKKGIITLLLVVFVQIPVATSNNEYKVISMYEEYAEEISTVNAPDDLKWYIWYHSDRLGINHQLVCAIINHESRWDSVAVNWNTNGSADLGLAKLNSNYIDWYKEAFFDGNVEAFDCFNPEHNVNVSMNIIKWLKDNTDNEVELILAYNRGLTGAKKYRGLERTQRYVQKVLVNFKEAC